ncbi:MAG TPA: hypothetical protein VFT64_08455 [Rickettsiales bacterium]|nr:hypothetical protein [Rickettsiales bacterium]
MMIIDWLTENSRTVMTVGGFTAFTAIFLLTYWPSRKQAIQEQAMIPFKEHNDEQ